MPNRILKESICDSETINKLAAPVEVFFYRLIVKCDDYGRVDARLPILRSRLYPLRLDAVQERTIQSWLNELIKVGLVWVYHVNGHRYLQVTNWDEHQQVRAKRSKCPEPPESASNGNQLQSNAGNSPRESESEYISESESESESNMSDSSSDVCAPHEDTHILSIAQKPKRAKSDSSEKEMVKEIFDYYKQKIQPAAIVGADVQIKARLKTFTIHQLKQGMDNFAADEWWMEHNAHRGAKWYFQSDQRSEQFLNLKAEVRNGKPSDNGRQPEGDAPARTGTFAKHIRLASEID